MTACRVRRRLACHALTSPLSVPQQQQIMPPSNTSTSQAHVACMYGLLHVCFLSVEVVFQTIGASASMLTSPRTNYDIVCPTYLVPCVASGTECGKNLQRICICESYIYFADHLRLASARACVCGWQWMLVRAKDTTMESAAAAPPLHGGILRVCVVRTASRCPALHDPALPTSLYLAPAFFQLWGIHCLLAQVADGSEPC